MSVPRTYSDPEVLARIQPLGLRARHAVRGSLAGVHSSPLLGQSVEFADYREYAPGDDMKRVDWRVYARTGRHVVKQYEEETNLRATFVVDASASMRYGSGAMTKFDYASTAAASLATLVVEQRDAAGLIVFDEAPTHRFRASSKRLQLGEMIATLERAEPDRRTELGDVLDRAAEELPSRGLVFLLSDFLCDLDGLFRALGRLRSRAHETILLHVLDPDELELPFQGNVEFRDLEGDERVLAEPQYFRDAYRAAMRRFCAELEGRAKDFGSDYELLRTDRPLGDVLSFYLHRRQRHIAGGGRGGAVARRASLRSTSGGGA